MRISKQRHISLSSGANCHEHHIKHLPPGNKRAERRGVSASMDNGKTNEPKQMKARRDVHITSSQRMQQQERHTHHTKTRKCMRFSSTLTKIHLKEYLPKPVSLWLYMCSIFSVLDVHNLLYFSFMLHTSFLETFGWPGCISFAPLLGPRCTHLYRQNVQEPCRHVGSEAAYSWSQDIPLWRGLMGILIVRGG